MVAKANVVEADKNNKRKREYNPNTKNPKKFKGNCHSYGKNT